MCIVCSNYRQNTLQRSNHPTALHLKQSYHTVSLMHCGLLWLHGLRIDPVAVPERGRPVQPGRAPGEPGHRLALFDTLHSPCSQQHSSQPAQLSQYPQALSGVSAQLGLPGARFGSAGHGAQMDC